MSKIIEEMKHQRVKPDCLSCSNLKREAVEYKHLQSTIFYYSCVAKGLRLQYGRFNSFLTKIRRGGCEQHSSLSISNLKPEVGASE